MKTERRSRIVLAAVAAGAVALVAVAVYLAVRPPPAFDPTTPQGTAQQYYRAALDGDWELARGYLTADVAGRCRPHEYRFLETGTARVVVTGSEIVADRAEVDVRITETWGEGPFEAGSDRFRETLFMEHDGDRWLIARPAWPMEFACS